MMKKSQRDEAVQIWLQSGATDWRRDRKNAGFLFLAKAQGFAWVGRGA